VPVFGLAFVPFQLLDILVHRLGLLIEVALEMGLAGDIVQSFYVQVVGFLLHVDVVHFRYALRQVFH
jgi:hypothetical protein